jgi:hypothetical protein
LPPSNVGLWPESTNTRTIVGLFAISPTALSALRADAFGMCTAVLKNCVDCVASIPPTETSGRLRIRIVTRFATGCCAGVHELLACSSYSRSHVNVPATDGNAKDPLPGLSAPVTLGSSSA